MCTTIRQLSICKSSRKSTHLKHKDNVICFSFITVFLWLIQTMSCENVFTPECCCCPHSSETQGSWAMGGGGGGTAQSGCMGKKNKLNRVTKETFQLPHCFLVVVFLFLIEQNKCWIHVGENTFWANICMQYTVYYVKTNKTKENKLFSATRRASITSGQTICYGFFFQWSDLS